MDFGNYCWNLPAGSLMKRMLKAEAHEGFNTAPGGKLKCTTKWGWIVKGLKLDFRAIELTENYIYIYIPVVPHKAVAEVSKIGNL